MSAEPEDPKPENWLTRHWRLGALSTGNLLIAALLVTAACIGVAILLSSQNWGSSQQQQARLEFVKALLQVPLVLILGSAVKIVSDLYQSRRQRFETEETFWREIRHELVAAYAEVKQARRLLKARSAVRIEGHLTAIKIPVYDEQMEKISKERLRLESLKHRVHAWVEARKLRQNPTVLKQREILRCQLTLMEEYLGQINSEWEFCLSSLPVGSATGPLILPLSQLPCLRQMCLPTENQGNFRAKFRESYTEALKAVDVALSAAAE